MIERIKSLKTDLAINLFNRYSRNIYALDSINLIIGNNGKGKTTLIKSIIQDLTETGSPQEFIADGVSDRLGIIYYTATPFHKTIKAARKSEIAFLDASGPQQQKQNFIDSAVEYLAISKVLGLDRKLRSIQSYDLLELAFEFAVLLFRPGVDEHHHIPSDELRDAYTVHRRANFKYRKTNRRIQELDDRPSNFSPDQIDDFASERLQELHYLNMELENIAKDIISAKEMIGHVFLTDCGFLDDARCINWIAAQIMLEARTGVGQDRELARRIYRDYFRFDEPDSTFEKWWRPIRNIVGDFVDALKESGSGSIRIRKGQIEISVNTARLVRANIDPRLIEMGHKHGLVRIGFESMSSGQAAIMHQMISISHSIQQLKSLGKQDILVFIDEGDLLLHLNWQREYISLLDKRLSNFKKGKGGLNSLQVIIASHSPLLASDILRDSITRLDDGTKLPSFGAPIQQIVNYSFGTPSIGLIAQRTIERLKSLMYFSDVDIELINQIDDDFIREYLLKKAGK